jgi:nicotinamidase-related amidase
VDPAVPTVPGRSRLAVIDMQHVSADAGGPWAAPRFAEIVEPVGRLVDAFGDRVTFTRFVAPGDAAGAGDGSHQGALAAMGLYAPLVRIVTTAEVVASEQPASQEPASPKSAPQDSPDWSHLADR